MIGGANELMAKFVKDGAVELYHDNVKRLETTSSGVSMTNGLVIEGTTTFNDDANFTAAIQINGASMTATAAELNILDGATLTTTELNYVDGVTSPIQTQLDTKVDTTGTPANTQLAIFSDSDTIKGNANLTFDGATGSASDNTLEISGGSTHGPHISLLNTTGGSTTDYALMTHDGANPTINVRNGTSKGGIKFQGNTGTTPTTYGGFDASGNFEIGTTDVIDGSRNLTNIGTISSGAIASSGQVYADELRVTNDALFEGSIDATGQTIASGAITSTGTSTFGSIKTDLVQKSSDGQSASSFS